MPIIVGLLIAAFLLLLALQALQLLGSSFPLEIIWSSILLIISSADLMVHEGGHVYFSFLGEFLHILGGTLTQLLFPGVWIFICVRSGYRYILPFGLFWLGLNFLEIAPYIGDARARVLPLFGDAVGHDWAYILEKIGLLQFDTQLAACVKFSGVSLLFLAIALIVANSTCFKPLENYLKRLDGK